MLRTIVVGLKAQDSVPHPKVRHFNQLIVAAPHTADLVLPPTLSVGVGTVAVVLVPQVPPLGRLLLVGIARLKRVAVAAAGFEPDASPSRGELPPAHRAPHRRPARLGATLTENLIHAEHDIGVKTLG